MAEAEIAAAGPAEAVACAENMNRMLESATVGFVPGSAEFRRQDAKALDELAAIARLCGEGAALELEVNGDALTEARAAAVADYLERSGAARPRLAAINYGPAAGGRVMDTGAAAGSDRPLEFTVRERSGQ